MQFRVGAHVYVLEVVAERPLDADGRPSEAVVDFYGQRILIHGKARGSLRLSLLLHELRHAWVYHFSGSDMGPEAEADLAAAYAQMANEDLAAQGGVEALGRLGSPLGGPGAAGDASGAGPFRVDEFRVEPLTDHAPAELARAAVSGGRAQCARCGGLKHDGQVQTGPPRWSSVSRGWVVDRTLGCEHCGLLQSWVEGSSPDGMPSGVVVEGPVFEEDPAAVSAFFESHPEAGGLLAC